MPLTTSTILYPSIVSIEGRLSRVSGAVSAGGRDATLVEGGRGGVGSPYRVGGRGTPFLFERVACSWQSGGEMKDYGSGRPGNELCRMLKRMTSTICGRIASTRARSLALLTVVALLLCHGFFGALHLFPDGQVAVTEVAAEGSPLTGAGDAHDEPAVQSAGKEYFAVLVVLVLFLGLLLRGIEAWRGVPAPRPYFSLRTRLRVPHPARGPTAPLLQVFRL